jgi:hypothetical protein
MYTWVNFDGNWVHHANESVFLGGTKAIPVIDEETSSGAAVKRQGSRKKTQSVASSGFCVSNAHLSEGDIKVDVLFDQTQEHQTAEIMVQWIPATKSALHVGLSGPTDALFSIRLWGDKASSTVTRL